MQNLRSTAVIVAAAVAFCTVPSPAQVTRYVIMNDDNNLGNSATFFKIGAGGALTQTAVVPTGGIGYSSYFASPRATVLRSNGCIYISNNGDYPGTVSGIVESTQTLAGTFAGSAGDNGDSLGIGIAVTNSRLYAAFAGSGTIGTYKLLSGCKLQFVTDTVGARGLNGGGTDGIKAHGEILVVAYADGSIESFSISRGVPVSNNDKQFSTGGGLGFAFPAGVDISQDGHWAIFGDAAYTPTVEVSDISAGSLSPTVVYQLTSGSNSNNVLLSPDQTLLYVSNNSSGQVTAAFFNKTTGVVSTGCTSAVLKNFNVNWYATAGIANPISTGTGRVLYVAEGGFGSPTSGIGIVKITSNGTSCTLTESASSPVADPQSNGNLMSIGVFPPRNW